MPRLFTGIEIPDEIRDDLARLRQPLPGARWVEPQNFHITLRFAGDIDNAVAREFAANLEQITFDPFPLRLGEMGTFGGNEPRTLWIGFESSEALTALARAHETAARRAGLPPEGRKFTPHITLARFNAAPRIDPVARFMQRKGAAHGAVFLVDHFVLFSSKDRTGGGPYVAEEIYHSTLGDFDGMGWDEDTARDYP